MWSWASLMTCCYKPFLRASIRKAGYPLNYRFLWQPLKISDQICLATVKTRCFLFAQITEEFDAGWVLSLAESGRVLVYVSAVGAIRRDPMSESLLCSAG